MVTKLVVIALIFTVISALEVAEDVKSLSTQGKETLWNSKDLNFQRDFDQIFLLLHRDECPQLANDKVDERQVKHLKFTFETVLLFWNF